MRRLIGSADNPSERVGSNTRATIHHFRRPAASSLAKRPFSPTGISSGPNTMANGGIQQILEEMGVTLRIEEAALSPNEATEYGGWKRLGMARGHFAEIVTKNERDGYFTVGLLATCPSMPGLVAGLQHSGPTRKPIIIGMLWLDAHPDFNTPETTRSGSLGGMPVALATGRALRRLRLDAHLDPPLKDRHIVMGGVRLTDPLEQELLDQSSIQQLSVDDLRNMTPAVFAQLDRLSRLTDVGASKYRYGVDDESLSFKNDSAKMPGKMS